MKNKRWIVIGLSFCAVIAVGIVGYIMIGNRNGSSDSAFVPDLDQNAAAVVSDEIADEPEGIRIPGYPTITIPADETEVTMNLMNPEGNPCYFTFELVLTETGETLYTSKMVEPGKVITDVTLSHGLSQGEHPAAIKITTASLEDGTEMNGANVETVLVAE